MKHTFTRSLILLIIATNDKYVYESTVANPSNNNNSTYKEFKKPFNCTIKEHGKKHKKSWKILLCNLKKDSDRVATVVITVVVSLKVALALTQTEMTLLVMFYPLQTGIFQADKVETGRYPDLYNRRFANKT